MSDSNDAIASHNGEEQQSTAPVDKGKGKAIDPTPDFAMEEEDDDSDEEESGQEDQVVDEAEGEEEEEDGMEEIDMDNIITDGRRTRGKAIDFAKAAQDPENQDLDDDDDEEDDDDFEDPDDDMQD